MYSGITDLAKNFPIALLLRLASVAMYTIRHYVQMDIMVLKHVLR